VLVDLRGHGKSTGKRIYFGLQETRDMSELLDALERDGALAHLVAAMGESYGAALALRWRACDPRVKTVVAIAPYANLSESVLNICREYAHWLPQRLVKSGLNKLPSLLDVAPEELNMTTVLARSPEVALFIAGEADKVTPPADVRRLYEASTVGSRFVTVPGATHEAVPYYFDQLAQSVVSWLDGDAIHVSDAAVADSGLTQIRNEPLAPPPVSPATR
jgi:pimeloyl-ACP methyl ester carboxylesterase